MQALHFFKTVKINPKDGPRTERIKDCIMTVEPLHIRYSNEAEKAN